MGDSDSRAPAVRKEGGAILVAQGGE